MQGTTPRPHGAGRLVQTFGTEKQKKLFLKKMFTGEWTGTMLLTEPEAGSDVGALTTAAVNLSDCSFDQDKGATALQALWRDPDYSSMQNAFYYVRE